MKKMFLLSLALCSSISFVQAGSKTANTAPTEDTRAEGMDKKIDTDVAAGTISKTDGETLHHQLDRVKKMDAEAMRTHVLTARNKGEIKKDLDKLDKDLARKEKQATAAAAAAAAASPSP